MSSNVYEQHKAHTKSVSAYAILKEGEHVANVTIRFPADGSGRLYAYVHWLGTQMIRGSASGSGYDKRSSAVACAARQYLKGWAKPKATANATPDSILDGVRQSLFWESCAKDRGQEWADAIRAAGFTVICVC